MTECTSDVGIDRAWGVLLGASLCLFCGVPAVIYFTFGVFVPEIIADTHWPAAAVAAAIGPAAMLASLTAPAIGFVSDKFGVRPLAMVGGPVFGLGIAALGWASVGPGSFSLLTILMFVLAFAGSPIAYAQALTGWFDKRRGLALSIMFCVGALGIAVWPIYAAALIANIGWRPAYVAMGATAGTVIFLSAVLFLRNAPKPTGSSALGAVDAVPGLRVPEALRTARFWKMASAFLLLSAVLGGMAVQLPVLLRREGADAQTGAVAVSVIGIFMFVGRLVLSFILDRWFAPRVTVAIASVSVIAFVLLMMTTSHVAIIVAAAFIGFGIGTEYAIAAYMTSRAFGFRAYGTIYGLISMAVGFGTGIGPAAIGIALVSNVPIMFIASAAIAVLLIAISVLLSMRKQDLPYVAGA